MARHVKGALDVETGTLVAWRNMLMRCYYTKHISYKEYGGRGIRVAPEWHPESLTDVEQGARFVFNKRNDDPGFLRFLQHLGYKTTKRHSLDRHPDVNGNYEPGNVRWATPEEQGVNKRGGPKMVRHPQTGQPIMAVVLAKELGLVYQVMRARMIKAGTWNELDEQTPTTT